MKELFFSTPAREALVDITREVAGYVQESGVKEGAVLIYVPHTTAGVLVNENADPAVGEDLLAALRRLVPDNAPYRHAEGNAPAHVKTVLVGSSQLVPVRDGKLALGTWQGIFLAEFDGPRRRRVMLTLLF